MEEIKETEPVAASKYASLSSSLERRPGELFRAMGRLFVESRAGWTRQALARELQSRLAARGVAYHLRTLKRQLTGSVRSVPPEVENALRQLLVEAGLVRRPELVERAVGMDPAHAAPSYVEVDRLVPLTQLWIGLNPGASKRSLAQRVQRRLRSAGESYTLDSLQAILAGKQHRLARQGVLDGLLEELKRCGIASEEEARKRYAALEERDGALNQRDLVDARDFLRLCNAWRVRSREPSSRRLARRLRAELARGGLRLSLAHTQALVNGRVRRVRRAVLEAMRALILESLAGERDAKAAFRVALARADDLAWASGEAVVEQAREWLADHPDKTRRQLAVKLSRRVRALGYSMTPATIQHVLSGERGRTRGFLLRAMAEELAAPPEQGAVSRRCRTRSCVMPAVTRGYCRACWLAQADPGYFARRDEAAVGV